MKRNKKKPTPRKTSGNAPRSAGSEKRTNIYVSSKPRLCVICGEVFTPNSNSQKTCGERCRREYYTRCRVRCHRGYCPSFVTRNERYNLTDEQMAKVDYDRQRGRTDFAWLAKASASWTPAMRKYAKKSYELEHGLFRGIGGAFAVN